jgi:AcrR family transcriptional regulator
MRKWMMAGRSAKTTADQWVLAAKAALIAEGIGGVRVDRLASDLGVTRGGFYHNFRTRDDLLKGLLELWEGQCQLVPSETPAAIAGGPSAWIEDFVERVIEERAYDHGFDMAVREWARSDKRAAWAIERADRQRVEAMREFFAQLGFSETEAELRARVLYYHQIGYYAIDVRETKAVRRRNTPLYLRILCGEDWVARAAAATGSTSPRLAKLA